jgi:hypothetical protein
MLRSFTLHYRILSFAATSVERAVAGNECTQEYAEERFLSSTL